MSSPLRHLYFDPIVLAYLGENPSNAPCLTAYRLDTIQGLGFIFLAFLLQMISMLIDVLTV